MKRRIAKKIMKKIYSQADEIFWRGSTHWKMSISDDKIQKAIMMTKPMIINEDDE